MTLTIREVVPVTGKDREAAVAHLFHYVSADQFEGDGWVAHQVKWLLSGQADTDNTIQAFARHRLAALSTPAAETGEGMRPTCSICGGRTFANVDVRWSDGTYAPGPERRCVECKTTFTAQAYARLSPAPVPATREGCCVRPTVSEQNQGMQGKGESLSSHSGWVDEDKAADMIAFGASEAAGYLYPEGDQQAVRAAYCEGAAQGARALHRWQADRSSAPQSDAGDGWRTDMEAARQVLSSIAEQGEVAQGGEQSGNLAEVEEVLARLTARLVRS